MRFFYYLFMVKRRIITTVITLAAIITAWGIKTSVVRNEVAAPADVRSALLRSVVTDWDMCANFHPNVAASGVSLNAVLTGPQAVTRGQLDTLQDAIDRCAAVTVPLTGVRAATARKKAGRQDAAPEAVLAAT
jgi:hypothetical protein